MIIRYKNTILKITIEEGETYTGTTVDSNGVRHTNLILANGQAFSIPRTYAGIHDVRLSDGRQLDFLHRNGVITGVYAFPTWEERQYAITHDKPAPKREAHFIPDSPIPINQ